MLIRVGNQVYLVGGGATVPSGGSGGTTTPPAQTYATTFTTSLSPTSGQAGTMATYVVTPGSAGFPAGRTVLPVVTGFSTPSAQSPATGSATPLTFVLMVTGAAGSTAIANVSINGMANQTGAQTFAIAAAPVVTPPPTPTTTTNHYDVALASTRVPAGTAVPGTIIPTNGLWKSGTITLAPSNGDPVINVQAPSGGNGALSFSYTPTKEGEIKLVPSNTAGFYDGAAQQLNVFASSAGTPRTITAHFAVIDLLGTQRQTPSGDPSGFQLWGKGAGARQVVIDSIDGSTTAIWMQPFACDPNATNSSPGASLHGAAQVYGTVGAAGSINVLLPAGIPWVMWKIAGDQSMTNAFTLPQRARVGHVRFMAGRSLDQCIVNSYAYGYVSDPNDNNYNTTGNAAILNWPAYNQNTTTFGAFNNHTNNPSNMFDGNAYSGGVPRGFLQYDKASVMAWQGNNGAHAAIGAQVMGGLCEATLGVGLTIVFGLQNGEPTDQGISHTGDLEQSVSDLITLACPAGFREFTTGWAINGDEWSDRTYPNSIAETVTRYSALFDKMAKRIPGCGVMALGSLEGFYGNDGSFQQGANNPYGQIGYTRLHAGLSEQVAAVNPQVVMFFHTIWNARYYGHPSMGSRIPGAQSRWLTYMQGEHSAWGGYQLPYAKRGPTFSRSAQYIPGQRLVRLFGTLNGASAVSAQKFHFNDQMDYGLSGGASPAELASAFSVYPGYPTAHFQADALPTTGAQISTANLPSGADFSVDITLAAAPAGSELTVQTCEFGNSNSTVTPDCGYSVAITDVDHRVNGILFGFEAQPQIDIHVTVS